MAFTTGVLAWLSYYSHHFPYDPSLGMRILDIIKIASTQRSCERKRRNLFFFFWDVLHMTSEENTVISRY